MVLNLSRSLVDPEPIHNLATEHKRPMQREGRVEFARPKLPAFMQVIMQGPTTNKSDLRSLAGAGLSLSLGVGSGT